MIREKIGEADMILIGLGEELEERNLIKDNAVYTRGCELLEKNDLQWLLPGWREYFVELNGSKLTKALNHMLELIKDKNYFAVTTCIDSRIKGMPWKDNRIVMPCGDEAKLQCSHGCEGVLCDVLEKEKININNLFSKISSDFVYSPDEDIRKLQSIGQCECCGSYLVLNNIYNEQYNESGYLEQWNKYLKWLQGTVNKKLLVLEIGVGMNFPSVIRWPFEKTVFFNNKAELVRVNESLYQMAEELSSKGIGIRKNGIEWLCDL